MKKQTINNFTFLLFTFFVAFGCSPELEEFPGEISIFPNPFVNRLNINMVLERDSEVAIYLYRPKTDNAQIVVPSDFDENANPFIQGNFQAGDNNLDLSFENRENGTYIMDFVIGESSKRLYVVKEEN